MKMISPAFKENAAIPPEFTCEGLDESPPLVIKDIPEAAKSLALIAEDPDAPSGTFTHWVLFNLPPSKTRIERNLMKARKLADGTEQGINDYKKTGYGGPCPPSGRHRYFFKLYALDTLLHLPEEQVTKACLLSAMKNHILDDAQLVGTYQKMGAVKSEKAKADWKVQEASEESFPASDAPANY